MTPVRIGIVGVGAIARIYIAALRSIAGAVLAAVCDVDPEACGRAAHELDCVVYHSHAAMALSGDVEVAIVCTPPASHASICCDLVRAGMHVICEKPFATTAEEVREVLDLGRRLGRVVTMGSKFRFVPAVERARSMIESGALGRPISFENWFRSAVDMRNRWYADKNRSGGGVLIDNGTHSFDLMRNLVGPVAWVQVRVEPGTQGLGVEEAVDVTAATAAGTEGRIHLSWSDNVPQPLFARVVCEDGHVALGWSGSTCKMGNSDESKLGPPYDKMTAFRAQLEEVIGAVRERAPMRIGDEDIVASVDAVQAGYQSIARHGARVNVECRVAKA